MNIRTFFTPGLAINSYLIFDEESRRGAIVDPTRQVDVYIAQAAKDKVAITDIIETHVHADFVSGALELKAALGGKSVIHCSGMGGSEWIPSYADHVVQNRDIINLGSIRLEALHTPGHTPEHIIWIGYDEKRSQSVPEIAFTGDLLMVGSIGRPDLLGEETQEMLTKQLYRSLFAVLHALPEFIEIYPSHGAGSLCGKGIGSKPTSTLGYEKRCNPWLIPQDYRKWVDSLQLNTLPVPSYFKRMKQVNVQSEETTRKTGTPPSLTAQQVKALSKSTVIVDVRRPDDFAAGNIKGSINIPVTPTFPLWAGVVLPHDKELLLVVDKMDCVSEILQKLNLVGLNNVAGVVDLSHWKIGERTELLSSSPSMTVGNLYADRDKIYLLDVRNDQEWLAGHIDGAHQLELTKIPESLNAIPVDRPIAVICHSGNRASTIASLLEKELGAKTFNVKGGMQAWTRENYPVVNEKAT